jgi:hypothetical protein
MPCGIVVKGLSTSLRDAIPMLIVVAASLAANACHGADRPLAVGAMDAGSGGMELSHSRLRGLWGESSVSSQNGGFSIKLTMHNVPASSEDTVCVLLELPNEQPIWSRDARATLSAGSHHFTVSTESADIPVQTTPRSCNASSEGTMVLATQQAEATTELPPGVGVYYEPHQHVYVQLHYINTTAAPIAITGTADIAPTQDRDLLASQSALYSTLNINLAPHSPGSAQLFKKLQAPADSAKVRHVFGVAPHTHRMGVHTTIERVSSDDAPASAPIYESRDWENPDEAVFDPPLVFGPQDGLRLTCDYMNDTDQTVRFGLSATNEMCALLVNFYDE